MFLYFSKQQSKKNDTCDIVSDILNEEARKSYLA